MDMWVTSLLAIINKAAMTLCTSLGKKLAEMAEEYGGYMVNTLRSCQTIF